MRHSARPTELRDAFEPSQFSFLVPSIPTELGIDQSQHPHPLQSHPNKSYKSDESADKAYNMTLQSSHVQDWLENLENKQPNDFANPRSPKSKHDIVDEVHEVSARFKQTKRSVAAIARPASASSLLPSSIEPQDRLHNITYLDSPKTKTASSSPPSLFKHPDVDWTFHRGFAEDSNGHAAFGRRCRLQEPKIQQQCGSSNLRSLLHHSLKPSLDDQNSPETMLSSSPPPEPVAKDSEPVPRSVRAAHLPLLKKNVGADSCRGKTEMVRDEYESRSAQASGSNLASKKFPRIPRSPTPAALPSLPNYGIGRRDSTLTNQRTNQRSGSNLRFFFDYLKVKVSRKLPTTRSVPVHQDSHDYNPVIGRSLPLNNAGQEISNGAISAETTGKAADTPRNNKSSNRKLLAKAAEKMGLSKTYSNHHLD